MDVDGFAVGQMYDKGPCDESPERTEKCVRQEGVILHGSLDMRVVKDSCTEPVVLIVTGEYLQVRGTVTFVSKEKGERELSPEDGPGICDDFDKLVGVWDKGLDTPSECAPQGRRPVLVACPARRSPLTERSHVHHVREHFRYVWNNAKQQSQ